MMQQDGPSIQTGGKNNLPPWLQKTLDAGFIPYIATSRHLLPSFNLNPYGVALQTFAMEDHANTPFLEAYLLANSLSFKSPDYKMPNWVCVDCVLVPEAIVGFMAPIALFPDELLDFFRKDPCVDFDKLTHIPVSGQVDTCAADGGLVNFSLFSLGRQFDDFAGLSLYTKALSLETHKAREMTADYRVILQYDNPSMKVHGRVSSHMEIEQPMVPLHPSRDMTLVIRMKVDFDPWTLDDVSGDAGEPTFWMESKDRAAKQRMQDGIGNGFVYEILPPYAVRRSDGIYMPILEKKANA